MPQNTRNNDSSTKFQTTDFKIISGCQGKITNPRVPIDQRTNIIFGYVSHNVIHCIHMPQSRIAHKQCNYKHIQNHLEDVERIFVVGKTIRYVHIPPKIDVVAKLRKADKLALIGTMSRFDASYFSSCQVLLTTTCYFNN